MQPLFPSVFSQISRNVEDVEKMAITVLCVFLAPY